MEHGAVQKRFHLLQPKVCPPRLDRLNIIMGVQDPRELDWIIAEHPSNELLALDFETKGAEPASLECYPVGVAFADSRGSCYVDLVSCPGAYEHLMRRLYDARTPLCAHNVFFDSAWPLRDFDLYLNWAVCTLATYRLTANEGFFGQVHGLKAAQLDMLGWTETNEEGLDRWLIDHGYHQSVAKEKKEGYYFYPEWLVGGKPEPRWVSPNKGEMWRAPADILGFYACQDADSCWLLWTEVLQPCVERFTFLKEYIYDWYPEFLRLLAYQKRRGVRVNKAKMEIYKAELDAEAIRLTDEFLARPEVVPHIQEYNASVVAEVQAKEPERFKKQKPVGEEPAMYTKAGAISRNWERWKARASEAPTQSKVWENWKARLEAAASTNHFNLGSGDQKRWLLYDKLGFEPKVFTDSGLPATDGDALLGMGGIGKALSEINAKQKVSQFCALILSLLIEQPDGSHTLHANFSTPGTVTGRLSSNSPNLQNQPKDLRYLECFEARSGYRIITCDVVSLENYVLAELSKDPSLWKLYGPDARPGQDAYLFNAAQLPVVGPKIRSTGYDPDTASPEETKKAKKECKPERGVGKTFTLSANYGAGPGKIFATLKLNGVNVTFEQVEEMHKGFWTIYAGIKQWEKELERQWRKNKGWLFNGVGRPLAVCEDKRKDLVNSVGQSTGHDCFIYWLLSATRLLTEAGIEWYPWLVDLHDCGIFEVREDQVELAKRIMEKDAYAELNDWLGGEIRLKGEAKICRNWREDKEE